MKKNAISSSFIISCILLIAVMIILFEIKYKVSPLSKELNIILKEILKTKEDIHILEAEWSYVTKLESLNRLVKNNLKLESIDPKSVRSTNFNNLNQMFPKTH